MIAHGAKCATLNQQRQRLQNMDSKLAALTSEPKFPDVSVEQIGSEGQVLGRAPNEHTFERHVGPLECQEVRANKSPQPCSVFNDNAAADSGIAKATDKLINGTDGSDRLPGSLRQTLTNFKECYDNILNQDSIAVVLQQRTTTYFAERTTQNDETATT